MSHYQTGLELGKKREERSILIYPSEELSPPDYRDKSGAEGNTSKKTNAYVPSQLPCLPGAGPL